MALPVMRRPKTLSDKIPISLPTNKNYVLLTLKGDKKLVVASDSYNGILSIGDIYKCIFCETVLNLEQAIKDCHINSCKHLKTLEKYPHIEEFSYNLVRKLTEATAYCTICNVIVANIQLTKHIQAEAHLNELERASVRALTYKTEE